MKQLHELNVEATATFKSLTVLFFVLCISSNLYAQKKHFCGVFPPHQASSSNLDSIYYDRFGNSYDIPTQSVPTRSVGGVTGSCTQGYFDLTFKSNCNGDSFGVERQNIACAVFNEISMLIQQRSLQDACGNNLPTVENINIDIVVSEGSMGASVIAAASGLYYFDFDIDCNTNVPSSLYKKINGINGGPTLTGERLDGKIMVDVTKFNQHDLTLPIHPDLYDYYSIIYHEAVHLLGFASEIPNDDNRLITGFDLLLQNTNGENIADNNCSPNGCADVCYEIDPVNFPGGQVLTGSVEIGSTGLFTANGPLEILNSMGMLVPNYQVLSHFQDYPNEDYLMEAGLPKGRRVHLSGEEQNILCSMGYKLNGVCEGDCFLISERRFPEATNSTDSNYSDCCTNIFHDECNGTITIPIDTLLCIVNSDSEVNVLDISVLNKDDEDDFVIEYNCGDDAVTITQNNFSDNFIAIRRFKITYGISSDCGCKSMTALFRVVFDQMCQDNCSYSCDNLLCFSDFSNPPNHERGTLGFPFLFEPPPGVALKLNSPDIVDGELILSKYEAALLVINGESTTECDYTLKFKAKNNGSNVNLQIWSLDNPPCHTNDRLIPWSCGSVDCNDGPNYTAECIQNQGNNHWDIQNSSYQEFTININYNELDNDLNYIMLVPDGASRFDGFSLEINGSCGHAEFLSTELECDYYEFTPITAAYVSHNWIIYDEDSNIVHEAYYSADENGTLEYDFENGTYFVELTVTDECGNTSISSTDPNDPIVIDCLQEIEACNTTIHFVIDASESSSFSYWLDNFIPHTTQTNQFGDYSAISGVDFQIQGTIVIDVPVSFSRCKLYFEEHSGFLLFDDFTSSESIFDWCDGVKWNGISVQTNSGIRVKTVNETEIRNSNFGLQEYHTADMLLQNTTFSNNTSALSIRGLTEVENCRFFDNDYCLNAQGASGIIINSLFANFQHGISLQGCSGLEIRDCDLVYGSTVAIRDAYDNGSNGLITVVDCNIDQCKKGVVFSHSHINTNITHNTISTEREALDLSHGNFTIEDNPLIQAGIGQSNYNYYSAIEINNASVTIDNNVIEKIGSGAGISLTRGWSGTSITHNDITAGGVLGNMPFPGIDNRGADPNSIISDNVISVHSSAGIWNQNSVSPQVECNDILSTGSHFVTSGIWHDIDADEAFLTGNYLDAPLDLYTESTIVNPIHVGNCFNGDGVETTYDLFDLQLIGMIFKVDPDDNPCYLPPPSNTIPQGWFDPESGDTQECTGVPGSTHSIGTRDTTRLCRYLEHLQESLQDSTKAAEAKMRLISLLRMLNDTTIQDQVLPSCLDTIKICGLDSLLLMDSLITTVILGSDTLRSQINVISTQTNTMLRQWSDYIASSEGNQLVRDSLRHVFITRLNQLKTILIIRYDEREITETIIDSIPLPECDSLIILELLAYKFMAKDSLSAAEKSTVDSYARYCSKVYGRGVHSMRAIAASFSDYDYRIHDFECGGGESEEEGEPLRPRIGKTNEVMQVYPNPSTGKVSVLLTNPENVKRLEVKDIYGYNYFGSDDLSSEQSFELDNSGIYYIVLHMKDATIKSEKIIIVK